MQKRYIDIRSFRDSEIPKLNDMLRTLFDWVSRIQYEKVNDATSAPSGGTHGELKLQNDGTNQVLWIYVVDAWYNVGDLISNIIDHTHSSTSGEGGQLDWDNIWSDAVHNHSSDAEGGTLDYSAITPPGSDTQIIFNDGGAFGADADLVWNKTNNRLGIAELSPESALEITQNDATFTLHNPTHQSAAGERDTYIKFKGEQSDGTEHVVAMIQARQATSESDQKGYLVISTNDGNDGANPSKAFYFKYTGDFILHNSDAKLGIGANASTPNSVIEAIHSSVPYLRLTNTYPEDTDEGRETKVCFRGTTSSEYDKTLAMIEGNHDGSSNDQKGNLIFKTNDGNDDDSPTERMRIDSTGYSNFQAGVAAYNNRDMLRYSFMMA